MMIPGSQSDPREIVASGPVAAAVLAASIGCFTMGLLTVTAAHIAPLTARLGFYPAAGALSGEGTITILSWLVSWAILARLWKHSSPALGGVLGIAYLLLVLGLCLSFPPIVHLLSGG